MIPVHIVLLTTGPCSEAHAPEMRNEVKLMLPQYSPDDSLGKIFVIPGKRSLSSFLNWFTGCSSKSGLDPISM